VLKSLSGIGLANLLRALEVGCATGNFKTTENINAACGNPFTAEGRDFLKMVVLRVLYSCFLGK
jgi:hypothetical protein